MRYQKRQEDKQLSKPEAKQLGRSLIDDQDFGRAIIFGASAALVSITLWVLAVETTGLIMTWYGLVVGTFVGFAVRLGGKGVRGHFAALGASLSIIACIAANFWSVYSFFGMAIPISQEQPEVFVEATLLEVAFFGVAYVDVAIWIIAGGLGAYLGKRPLDRQERFALSVFDMSKP